MHRLLSILLLLVMFLALAPARAEAHWRPGLIAGRTAGFFHEHRPLRRVVFWPLRRVREARFAPHAHFHGHCH